MFVCLHLPVYLNRITNKALYDTVRRTTPVVLDLELFEFFHWVAQNQCSIYLTLLLIVKIFSMLHKSGNYLRARGWI